MSWPVDYHLVQCFSLLSRKMIAINHLVTIVCAGTMGDSSWKPPQEKKAFPNKTKFIHNFQNKKSHVTPSPASFILQKTGDISAAWSRFIVRQLAYRLLVSNKLSTVKIPLQKKKRRSRRKKCIFLRIPCSSILSRCESNCDMGQRLPDPKVIRRLHTVDLRNLSRTRTTRNAAT